MAQSWARVADEAVARRGVGAGKPMDAWMPRASNLRIVLEVWEPPPEMDPNITPDEMFAPIADSEWLACGPEVQPNWTYDGTSFAPPVPATPVETPPPTITKRQLLWETQQESGKVDADVQALIDAQVTDPTDNYQMHVAWDFPDNGRFKVDDEIITLMETAGFFGAKTAHMSFWEASQT
jgi:hypothetical protein